MSVEQDLYATLYCHGDYVGKSTLIGVGVHGYICTLDVAKRGTGNPKAIPSKKGYIEKDSTEPRTTIQQYVDIMHGKSVQHRAGYIPGILSLLPALTFIDNQPGIKGAVIHCSNKAAVKGLIEKFESWKERNWVLPNGNVLLNQNEWIQARELYDRLKGRLEYLDIVENTEGVGAEKAVKNSSLGCVLAIKRISEHDIVLSQAQGYWAPKAEVPRILQAPRWYFMTDETDITTHDGLTRYFTGCHGTKDKEEDFVSKRYSDNFLGVVLVKESDPVMEAVRKHTSERDSVRAGRMAVVYLDNLLASKSYSSIQSCGLKYTRMHPTALDLMDADGTPLLVEINPPGRAFRLQNTWKSLSQKLDEIRSGDTGYTMTEITDLLYEGYDEKKKSRPLVSKISQATKYMDFTVGFNFEKYGDTPKVVNGNVRLILGEDLLTRNQLAALGDVIKRVCIVTWRDSDNVGRYATLIELVNGDIGLWVRFDANFYLRT